MKRPHTLPTTAAERADRFNLYERAVQMPEREVAFLERVHRAGAGRPARVLREDFSGTAAISRTWVRRSAHHRAIAVDLDQETLAWAKKKAATFLSPAELRRLSLVRGDVRSVETRADVIAALNFSYWIFETRDELRRYFALARSRLTRSGVLVLDAFGGSDAHRDGYEETRRVGRFTYVWESETFDPITHHCRYSIHFRFPDGSSLDRAFRYDWRLWTLPELREIAREAGFRRTDVYWEGTRGLGGNGVFRRRQHGEADPSWIAYVVATR